MSESVNKPLTGPQRNALYALRSLNDEHGDRPRGVAPRQVAKALWPDSPGWRKVSRRRSTPAGGAMGATMPMKAATLLWRLHERGLADLPYDSNLWTITDRGRRVLDGSDVPRPLPEKPKPTPVERSKK